MEREKIRTRLKEKTEVLQGLDAQAEKLIEQRQLIDNQLAQFSHQISFEQGAIAGLQELLDSPNEELARIVIGMPVSCNRKISVGTAIFCCEATNHGATWSIIIGSTATMARNVIVSTFLEMPDFTHIFFLDADTIPPMNAIQRLLTYDKDVVAGITPLVRRIGEEVEWSAGYKGNNIDLNKNKLPDHLFKADWIGGTTVLIKRQVFETIIRPYYKEVYAPEITKKVKGGDIYFSHKAKEAGFDLWVDPTIKCGHDHIVDLLDYTDPEAAKLTKPFQRGLGAGL